MRNRHASGLLALLVVLVIGCVLGCGASESGQPGGGAGGASGSGGTNGSGGESSSGGNPGGSGDAGGVAGDGAAGNSGSGGAVTDGGGNDASATGGSDGGTAGDGGAAVASAGCGKAGRPAGGRIMVANDHIYDFPANYDGMKPMPLVFGLHGANNPNTLIESQNNGSRLATNFVRVYPKSTGAAWSYSGGTGADSQRLTMLYNDLLANYCIDTSRVFLFGHSSGAQMSVQMMCAPGGDKRFKAVAPVAASKYCSMLTPVPVLYIQGMMDAMRGGGNGADVVAVFTASNMCMNTTMPDTAVPTCNSTFNNKLVTPGCVIYQGCVKPTIWCSHNDDVYNLTDGHEHGWPCFANNAIADFFLGLP